MATTTAPLLACPQGHLPVAIGSIFCTICGSRLVAALPPVQPPPPAFAPVPPQYVASQPVVTNQPSARNQAPVCKVCGDNGINLSPEQIICPECEWLRPLFPGYELDRSVFLWAQDGQAMTKLQQISALHTAVRTVSDKVGRPWIESTFNGILLGPNQVPDVWKLAVLAARILGLPRMPDVYISGDSLWVTYTFGSDNSAFIILGTAILNNFQDDELLFILAREMGHCRAGHALWKTVSRFLTGDAGPHGMLSNGLLNAISPTKLLEGAVEMPLMAWSRQSDVTADRAGLLAVGDEALARRVLLAWSIKSSKLLKQVNIEEWMKQEEASGDQMTRISEMTTSASMYTTRRLRLLGMAAREPELMRHSQIVQPARKALSPPKPAPAPRAAARAPIAHAAANAPSPPVATPTPVSADSIRVVCNKCQAPMRVPFTVLRGKTTMNVRCPQCQNIITLRPKSAAPPPPAPAAAQKQAG